MTKDLVAERPDSGEQLSADEAAARIERLERDLERFRKALEVIRDHPFEQSNSPRLTDQLWHFVRWSKATARTALEAAGEPDGDDS